MMWRFPARGLLFVLVTPLLLAAGGCQLPGEPEGDASLPQRNAEDAETAGMPGQSAPGTFRRLGAGLSRGWSKMISRGPSGISMLQNESAVIAANFPADEIPNTLLRKPLAAGTLGNDFGYQLDRDALLLLGRHTGIDYLASEGTEVYAAGDGTIAFLGKDASRGRMIAILHNEHFTTRYAYLGQFATGLREGDAVYQGDVIGTVGGQSDGSASRLHYELVYEDRYINPLLQ